MPISGIAWPSCWTRDGARRSRGSWRQTGQTETNPEYDRWIMDDLRNKRVTVAGLGHFGGNIAATRWLVQQGARVLVTDRADESKLADGLKQLEGLPVQYRLGGHDLRDFVDSDLVVASPAIKPSNEF